MALFDCWLCYVKLTVTENYGCHMPVMLTLFCYLGFNGYTGGSGYTGHTGGTGFTGNAGPIGYPGNIGPAAPGFAGMMQYWLLSTVLPLS